MSLHAVCNLEAIENKSASVGLQTAIDTVPEQSPWFALYVRAKGEKTVSDLLRRRGYEVFLPTYRVVRRWSDRTVELDFPLFPGYIFSRFDVYRRLPILQTPGVIQIVGRGRQPLPIPEQEMESVRRLVTAQADARPHPFLKEGDFVRVQTGPLKGVEGILVRRKGRHQLVVSIQLLQRSVAAEVHLADIRPL